MTEEERADLYRQQHAAGIRYRQQQLARLRGSEPAADRVREGFQPLVDALLERRTGGPGPPVFPEDFGRPEPRRFPLPGWIDPPLWWEEP